MKLNGGYVLLPQPIEEEALKLLKDKVIDVVQAKDPKLETVATLMNKARAIILRTGIKITFRCKHHICCRALFCAYTGTF